MASYSDPAELFDVVDERDKVIGQAPRQEVHARDLRHRAVHVLIHDARGRVFLQLRSPLKDSFPNCWDCSCTGHLDAGESYQAAARRELGEELGWHDATLPLRFVTKLSASPSTGWEFIEIYLMGPTEGPFALNPDEITEGRWIHPRDLTSELHQSPETLAGGLRHLWTHHREEVIALLSKVESSNL